ncbi:MAG: flagellar basal body P-ring protein FlgI [Planctomycetota bacterium]|nr:flagellar basal body P-ring protein FlgI [Planctomycetota bacterium]
MKKAVLAIAAMLVLLGMPVVSAQTASDEPAGQTEGTRIKDLARLSGADDNYLKGWGVVMGLNGTGDSPTELSRTIAASLLKKQENITLNQLNITHKNMAVVEVTALLPAFQSAGTRIDVSIASIFDAKSLKGGRLLITPLRGPGSVADDGTVYAIAQGPVSIGGDIIPTEGIVYGGAIVERTLKHTVIQTDGAVETESGELVKASYFTLVLNRPDWNAASAIANRLNTDPRIVGIAARTVADVAVVQDAGHIVVRIPADFGLDQAGFIARVLECRVDVVGTNEPLARVYINEKTKTWSVTGNVTVSTALVQIAGGYQLVIPDKKKPLEGEEPEKAPTGLAGGSQPGAAEKKTQPVEQTISLKRVLEQMSRTLPPDSVIAAIKALHRIGALNAELIVE